MDLYGAEAPDLPAGLEWLNVARPLSLTQLRGKLVLLDFWTYGCINCLHNLPDLERLQREYADYLVVIGVHSGKFPNERQLEGLRQVVRRYGITHPVVHDPGQRMWYDWGVEAWPTLVLVDPAGNLAHVHVGEGAYSAFRPLIGALIESFGARGGLDDTSLELKLERDMAPETLLSFPGKVLADGLARRLYIADSNHHRILVIDLDSGQVLAAAGSGARGLKDGAFSDASLSYPQGMALSPDGAVLYVADAGNHAIRQLDLRAETVTTLAGTGQQAALAAPRGGRARDVPLSSPWDLALEGDRLYVAMAGSHQLWMLDLGAGTIWPLAGTAVEGVRDGPLDGAALAQPSGLALGGEGRLFFVDAESSTVRWVDLARGQVSTLAGGIADLFQFGDLDGVGTAARLQHPLGMAYLDGWLYVADSYNHKVKRVNPQTGQVETLWGGERGWRDGLDPRFDEPGGLDALAGRLYVADTNNHAVRVIDLQRGETRTLVLRGLERFVPAVGEGAQYPDRRLETQRVGVGAGMVRLDLQFEPGFKVNDLVSSTFSWQFEGQAVAQPAAGEASYVGGDLPLVFPVTWRAGHGSLVGMLALYYCWTGEQGVCLVERARIVVPIEVTDSGPSTVNILFAVDSDRP